MSDSFAGVFALVEDELHLLRDGHFDVVAAGESEGGAGGEYAFGDFASEALKNFREAVALTECLTDCPVARERAGAGENEVADTGEAGEGFATATAGNGEAGDFCDATGDEGGGGVVPEADTGGDTGGDGDYVFESSAEFDADDVSRGVETEGF